MLEQILLAIAAAVNNRSTEFDIGPFDITVTDVAATPAHLTFAEAWQAIATIAMGQPGLFAIGDIHLVIVDRNAPPPVVVVPEAVVKPVVKPGLGGAFATAATVAPAPAPEPAAAE